MDHITDNLVDLGDHCLLCYRPARTPNHEEEIMEENEQSYEISSNRNQEKLYEPHQLGLCKRFLKLSSRYLNLPPAELTYEITCSESYNKRVKTKKRWENLINAKLCEACGSKVNGFCDLYSQLDYIKLQLQLTLQDLAEFFHFTNQDSSCISAKQMLATELTSRGLDSVHTFQLLDIFREQILTRADTMTSFPQLSMPRISDDHVVRNIHLDTNPITKNGQSNDAPEDSGVSIMSSISSPMSSPSSCDDTSATVEDRECPAKEYSVIRTVFTCKKCRGRFFTREKLNSHYKAAHPKETTTTSTTRVTSSESTAPTRSPPKILKIRKIVYNCSDKSCGRRFLTTEKLIEHVKTSHSDLPIPFFTSPSTSTSHAAVAGEMITNKRPVEDTNQSLSPIQNKSSGLDTNINPSQITPLNPSVKKRASYRKRNFNCAYKGCIKKFHTAEELVKHAQFHRTFQCKFCSELKIGPISLAAHEFKIHRKQKDGTLMNCPRCPDLTEKLIPFFNYSAHFLAVHLGTEAPLVKCSKCKSTVERACLKQHEKRCSKLTSPGTSASTEVGGSSTQNRQEPSTTHKTWPCNICNLPCNSAVALHSHLIARHDCNIKMCNEPNCNRLFKNADDLHKHRSIMHLKFKVCIKVCKHCTKLKTLKSIAHFNAHVKRCEQKNSKKRKSLKERLCPVCHQNFRNLGSHMRVHVGKHTEIVPISNQIANADNSEEIGLQPSPMDSNDAVELENESLGDRVKKRRRSGYLPDYAEEDSEDIPSPAAFLKRRGQGTKRMAKCRSTGKVNRDNRTPDALFQKHADSNDTKLRKKRKGLKANKHNQPRLEKTQNESESPHINIDKENPGPSSAIKKQEIISPVKPFTPIPAINADIFEDSSDSGSTIIINKVATIVTKNDVCHTLASTSANKVENLEERTKACKPEPDEAFDKTVKTVDIPVLEQRLKTWIGDTVKQGTLLSSKTRDQCESNFTTDMPDASSSKQCLEGVNKENASKSLSLSATRSVKENHDEEIEQKPQCSVLNAKIQEWRSRRQQVQPMPTPAKDPSNIEVVTLD